MADELAREQKQIRRQQRGDLDAVKRKASQKPSRPVVDSLVAAIAVHTDASGFDLTHDGLVNLFDRDTWLLEAGGINIGPGRAYRLGDATLDGFVDGSDFGRWNSNKFTSVAAWSKGDFNADGAVDGSDFGIWNSNKFTASDGQLREKRKSAINRIFALDAVREEGIGR